uniref:Reverse transcriptase domain-containing protein n=1 Tax=Graphocephala atropunctata TaxID=36148 RepID=A0A1B6KMM0_9HEMI
MLNNKNKKQMGTRNLNHLKAELKHSDWQPDHFASDSETAYNSFHAIINSALNATCPMKDLKTGKKQGPILSYDPEVRALKDDYIRTLNRFEITGNNEDRETMIAQKKLYDNKLRLLHQNLNATYITDADNKTKAIWNVINKKRKAKSYGGSQCKLEINKSIIKNPQDIVETFNTFAQAAEKTLNQNGTLQNRQQNPIDELTCHHSLTLSPTTFNEVVDTIKSLKTKTSSGVDEYSSKAVKHCAEELTNPLVSIINKSFSEGHFPSSLKLSKVYPKHKKGSISNLENYRPISLISTFSKLIEKNCTS